MSDIFLSYAEEDRDLAARLVAALEGRGLSVFWDRRIPAGRDWSDVLAANLHQAGCVVVLWTPNSVSSHWVLEEAEYGRTRRVLIPVRMESIEPPLGFRRIQASDLSKWTEDQEDHAIQHLFRDITRILREEAERKDEEQQRLKAIAEAKREAEEQQRQAIEAEARREAEEQEPHRAVAETNRAAREDQGPPAIGAEPQGTDRGYGRNIVLLSEGTGNFWAKLNRTNVWHLYQALDLGHDDQIAVYDEGVGTSGFRPLQLLGGAFGWGLSRNVCDLYKSVCTHYRPGDHIYIFGFSRGAFTARTLAGLVGRCGILDPNKTVPRLRLFQLRYVAAQLNTQAGLQAGVNLAYRSYRRIYDAPFARLFRRLRDLVLGKTPGPRAFRRDHALDEPVTIKFVGVWDTVNAVGMPVEELSTMVDRIFYPHRFPDQNLSPQVERACHAIAVDDERSSFHPVLWNEHGTADSERITQVWFAGMHSDVGGGYSDDGLARVSLHWMISQAKFDRDRGYGLRFDEDKLRAIEHRAQSLGKMHNSREGLGVYYRYGPRPIARLCDDPENDVWIAEPKIHQSVFDRIRNDPEYLPSNLPRSYRIVSKIGMISEANPEIYESIAERHSRAERLDQLFKRVQNLIFWRKTLYFMFVAVTLALVFMPYYRPPVPGAVPESLAEALLAKLFGWLPPLLPGSLGVWVRYWTEAWTQSPFWFATLAAVYGWLAWHSRTVAENVHRLSEAAWWPVKRARGSTPGIPLVGPFERLANQWHRSGPLHRFHRLSVRWGVPIVAAIMGTFVLGGAAYRLAVHLPVVGDGVCRTWLEAMNQGGAAKPLARQAGDGAAVIAFDTRMPCIDSGVWLEAGRHYVIDVAEVKDWKDPSYAAGLSGLQYLLHPAYLAGIPARRHLMLPWFALIAEIGRDSGHVFALDRDHVILKPTQPGRLFLYVNDAINPGLELAGLNVADADAWPITAEERQTGRSSSWYANYLNNAGTATITVTRED